MVQAVAGAAMLAKAAMEAAAVISQMAVMLTVETQLRPILAEVAAAGWAAMAAMLVKMVREAAVDMGH